MADAPSLPETTADGDPGHTAGHDDTNRSVNLLKTNFDAHTALTGTAHGGIISPNAYNAKGDVLVGTADNAYAVLPAGPDGELFVWDSTQTTGADSRDLLTMLEALGITAGGAAAVNILDEGISVGTVSTLDVIGSGVAAAYDAVNDKVTITVTTNSTTVVQKTVPSDQTITSSSSVTDASGLSQAIAASEVWEVDGILVFLSDPAADIKATMTAPAGSTQRGAMWGPVSAATSTAASTQHYGLTVPAPSGANFGGFGVSAGQETTVVIKSRLANGSTAGNWRPQWAQATGSATPSKLLAGSYLTFARVA